jgi:hypothetical protein
LHVVAPHTKAPHAREFGLHAPLPSQVLTSCSTPLAQLGVPHAIAAPA